MDSSTFQGIAGRLQEVNAVIEKLHPALREDAWRLLRPYVSGDVPLPDPAAQEGGREDDGGAAAPPPPDADEDVLIERFESDKDSDNLYLTLAVLYKRHGRGPYSIHLIKSTANSLGLDIPTRPDLTFRNSSRNVVRKQADRTWKVQPSGEDWLKETYGVNRGKDPIPSA